MSFYIKYIWGAAKHVFSKYIILITTNLWTLYIVPSSYFFLVEF